MKIDLKQATKYIRAGDVVAVPTETVYGLAASIKQPKAIKKIFKLKQRPQDNPLIVHVANESQLKSLVLEVPKNFKKLKKFWPGPLTIVFKANKKMVPAIIRAGLATVAIRMPKQKDLLNLIKKTGPLAAPSANVSGRPSPTCRAHVETDLGKSFPVLDGGRCYHGVESTVIQLKKTNWQLLRPGAVSIEEISKLLNQKITKYKNTKRPITPGQKYRHYAPHAKLTLCKNQREIAVKSRQKKYQAILGFMDTKSNLPLIHLGRRNHYSENLKRLYAALRRLDDLGYSQVLVDTQFKIEGLGATLWERLKKAAG